VREQAEVIALLTSQLSETIDERDLMRVELCRYLVIDRLSEWECLRCGARWGPFESLSSAQRGRYTRDPHADGCLLGKKSCKANPGEADAAGSITPSQNTTTR
jgi:hypothetical protein